MLRFLTTFVLAIALLSGPSAFSNEKRPNFESIFYSEFKTIEKFGLISVFLEGSADKLGLKKGELTDYLRLRFKNSFSGMEFKDPENLQEILVNTPPAQAGGFRLRLKAGSIGHAADGCRYTTSKSSSGSGGF